MIKMSDSKEKLLNLNEGRTLAYSENGNASSSTVVIFFHGVFGIGDASKLSRTLVAKNVHYVAPTLPGWGNSSPLPSSTSYPCGLLSDITALINHLHPSDADLKLYVCGGSYGTVPAQIIYGASFDVFPLGRQIAGLLLIAPFSPFRWHKDYTKCMTLPNYIMFGLGYKVPFRLLPRLAVFAIRGKVKTPEKAEKFIRNTLFDNMGEEERAAFAIWRDTEGRAEGQLEREMAENVARSVEKTWDGLLEVTDVLHGDWGYRPDTLDEGHVRRPILIVTSTGDKMAGSGMANWLVANYKNARLKSVVGGHLAALFHIDEIWTDFLEREPRTEGSSESCY